MRKSLCSLLVIALITVAAPAAAADKPGAAPVGVSNAAPLAGALEEAGPKVALKAAPAAATSGPRSLPRTSSGIRKQGRGGMGMAIGLISSLVGVAATVYVVKQMKDNDETR